MKTALIRHPSPAIEPNICYGRLDVGLTAAAGAQIRRIVADPLLQGAVLVWTSPAQRCRVLAEAIAKALELPLAVDPCLLELSFGDWEGRSWDEVQRSELDRWAADPLRFAPPGGESGAALIDRVRNFHARLSKDWQDSVVVSHGGPLKVLAALLLGAPVDLLAPAPRMGVIRLIKTDRRPTSPKR